MYANVRRRERIFMLAAFHILLAFLLNSTHSYWGEENLSFFFSLSRSLTRTTQTRYVFPCLFTKQAEIHRMCAYSLARSRTRSLSSPFYIPLLRLCDARASSFSLRVLSILLNNLRERERERKNTEKGERKCKTLFSCSKTITLTPNWKTFTNLIAVWF